MSYYQYQPVVGPLTTSAPLETTTAWQAKHPTPYDARRRGIITALTVMACVLPSTFAQGAVTPPTGWRPTYPDRVVRKVVHAAHQPSFSTRTFQPPEVLVTGGKSIPTGSMEFVQYQTFAGSFLDAPPVVPFSGQTPPVYPDTISRPTTHAARMPASVLDAQFTAPAAASVTALSWGPKYPDAVRRVTVHASRQQAVSADTETVPGVAASRNIGWLQRSVDRHVRPYPLAVYVWGQQHWGLEVDVPVMSWTGVYLDPPVRRVVRPFGCQVSPVDITARPPAPDSSWSPRYPDRVPPASRTQAALTTFQHGLPFVPDVTNVVPALSWRTVYPDRIHGKKRTPDYPAYFMDRITAPGVVVAPDLAAPVYPFRVYGKPRAAQYPDLQAVIGRQDPPPVVPDGSWIPKHPDRIHPKRSLGTAQQLAFSFWPDPIPTPSVVPVTGQHQFIVPMRQRVFAASAHRRAFVVPPRKRGVP